MYTYTRTYTYNMIDYSLHVLPTCTLILYRGYGETEKPNGVEHYTMETLTQDIVQLVSASCVFITVCDCYCLQINVLSSDGKCVLVAHDWGGIIAW